jgi:hypothetical protein
MNSIKNSLMAGMVVLAALSAAPAIADHDHHNDNNPNNFNHGNGRGDWDRRDINVRVNDSRHDNHDRHLQAASNNWNGERTIYRNNWNRVSRERQKELDAQMRAQWLAYHHNNYNGDYSWNTYNDPQFLDYLHTSNPGLLTTLRNYVGF